MQTKPSHTHSHCDVQVGICLVGPHAGILTWVCIHAHTRTTHTRSHPAESRLRQGCTWRVHTQRTSPVDGGQQPALVLAGGSRLLPACVFVQHPRLLQHSGSRLPHLGVEGTVSGERDPLGLWEEGMGTWTPGSERGCVLGAGGPLTSLAY